MKKKEILELLLEREKALKKRIKKERLSYSRLVHKSRRVRLNSPLGPRIGFFTDRLQELQNVIRLMQGTSTADEFLLNQNGDALDKLATFAGEVGQ